MAGADQNLHGSRDLTTPLSGMVCRLLLALNVGSRIDCGREFHSYGAQAAKLRGPKLVVWQASTCTSPSPIKLDM